MACPDQAIDELGRARRNKDGNPLDDLLKMAGR